MFFVQGYEPIQGQPIGIWTAKTKLCKFSMKKKWMQCVRYDLILKFSPFKNPAFGNRRAVVRLGRALAGLWIDPGINPPSQ